MLLAHAASSKRDPLLIERACAGGLRVSELVRLVWADVLEGSDGRVLQHYHSKGDGVRQLLLPGAFGRLLLSLRGAALPHQRPV